MRKAFLVGGVVLLGCAGLQAKGFEGEMDVEMTHSTGGTHMMHYQVKGTRVRMESEEKGRHMVMLMDSATRDAWSLSPDQKIAVKFTVPDVAPSERTQKEMPKITETGGTDTVAGHECRIYRFKGEKSEG